MTFAHGFMINITLCYYREELYEAAIIVIDKLLIWLKPQL